MNRIEVNEAGNWREQNFVWYGSPDDAGLRTLRYVTNRDASLITEANAAEIEEILAPFCVKDESGFSEATREHHGHWACGWIEGYSFLVTRDGINLTPSCQAWNEICDMFDMLEGYPILNDDNYSDLVSQRISDLDLFDLRCIAEDYLGIERGIAEEMTEEEIRGHPEFWDKATEWVEG